MKQEYAIPIFMLSMLFIGVLIRRLPIIRKSFIPAPIFGGIVGFILMNSGLINLDYTVYERIAFHLFVMSYISINFMSMNIPKDQNKGVFKGGLWLAMIFGLMLSIQAFIGSSIFLGFNKITGETALIPALGGMIAHGFAQGPGQAVAIGTIWEGFNVANAIQYGLFYAVLGYMAGFIVGIPFARWLIKKKKVTNFDSEETGEKENIESGLILGEKKEIFGLQTTHHSSVDTLSLHLSLVGFTYLLAYLFAELMSKFVLKGPQNEALLFGNMFVWGILFSMLIKKILVKTHFSRFVDTKIQGSITGTLVDYLILASLMAINIRIIYKGLFQVLLVIAAIIITTFIIVFFLAKRTGNYSYERFLAGFGIVTGSAATGILLLRIVDPQFKTPIAKEIVWFNLLNLFAGGIFFLSQFALPITNFWLWYIILAASIPVFLILMFLFGLFKPIKRK